MECPSQTITICCHWTKTFSMMKFIVSIKVKVVKHEYQESDRATHCSRKAPVHVLVTEPSSSYRAIQITLHALADQRKLFARVFQEMRGVAVRL